LRVIPLGGTGEFGKNTMALEYGLDLILVDCGQKFPEEEMYGVDMVIPDFEYVLDNLERLRALILTHGHEDHIGAVPYLIRQIPERRLPIYGSRLTLALVLEKLREMQLVECAELIVVEGGDKIGLGDFEVEFIAVSHSVPMAMALLIHLPIGQVIHTGDYKFELNDGDPPELAPFARAGDTGQVLLLMADSTNINREGFSPSEPMIHDGLAPVVAAAPRTVIVAMFSSSLHRVQTVLDLAQEVGRQVAICGFSLERNFSIATELGLLRYPDWLVLPLGELIHLPPGKRMILTTGTQGEPMSALSRLALNSFKGYTLQVEDLVIMSSRIIPGNEKAIYRMIDHFYRHGAKVVTERDAFVHGSGHAYRGEMRRMLQLVRPRYFMPIHGELRQLIQHRDLAMDGGIDFDRIFIIENGEQLNVGEGRAWRDATDWAGQVLVDGKLLDGLEEVILRDRKHLAEDGILTVILVIDRKTQQILAGPDFVSRGFVVMDDNEELIQACKSLVVRTYEECDKESREEWEVVKVAVRKALRKYLRDRVDRYPVILPVVVEI